jgi:hypothetical protein
LQESLFLNIRFYLPRFNTSFFAAFFLKDGEEVHVAKIDKIAQLFVELAQRSKDLN